MNSASDRCFERKSLTRHAIRDRFQMWLTTALSAPTPQFENGQLAFDRGTERKLAERRLRSKQNTVAQYANVKHL